MGLGITLQQSVTAFFDNDVTMDAEISMKAISKLETCLLVPLRKGVAPPILGVYALYHFGKLVYIGKASTSLKARLNEHVKKIAGRCNISLSDMECRFMPLSSEWIAWAAEAALIKHHTPPWNGMGFGSKSPGIGRPGTFRVSLWDQLYPLHTDGCLCHPRLEFLELDSLSVAC